jgi:hypothetical protein
MHAEDHSTIGSYSANDGLGYFRIRACRNTILVMSGLGVPPLSSCLVYRLLLDQPACQACVLIKEK